MPTIPPSPKELQRKRLTPDAIDAAKLAKQLAKVIDLNDHTMIQALANEVGKAWIEYQYHAVNFVSAGSRKVAIEPLLKKSVELLRGFYALDSHTDDFLARCGVRSEDLRNLERLQAGLRNAVSILKNDPKEVKPENVPKRVFAHRLTFIYMQLCRDRGPFEDSRFDADKTRLREFVRTAFDAANITYPDPTEHPDRFDDLLLAKRIY